MGYKRIPAYVILYFVVVVLASGQTIKPWNIMAATVRIEYKLITEPSYRFYVREDEIKKVAETSAESAGFTASDTSGNRLIILIETGYLKPNSPTPMLKISAIFLPYQPASFSELADDVQDSVYEISKEKYLDRNGFTKPEILNIVRSLSRTALHEAKQEMDRRRGNPNKPMKKLWEISPHKQHEKLNSNEQ